MNKAKFELWVANLLQWGRHPRTAESDNVDVGLLPIEVASMGPPSEDGGEASEVGEQAR